MLVFAFIIAAFFSISLSMWFISRMINKSNNKGDSKADFFAFSGAPLIIDDREDNKTSKVPIR